MEEEKKVEMKEKYNFKNKRKNVCILLFYYGP